MSIEFASLKRTYDLYADEYEEASLRALRSGWYILGNELQSFEEQFAEFTGCRFCVGVGNGQEALILALRALGIGPGDEVITQSNGYIASVLGITENGATPVFVEPDEFFLLNPDEVESHITERTKAILCVHMYGQASDMTKISSIAKKHGLYLIEDCAQSHGAMHVDKMTGSYGDIGCFSFYPTKPIGALGDAGACVTDSEEIADKLRKMRNYGSGKKYVNEIMGTNSRLDEVQAAALQVSLKYFQEGKDARTRIANQYLKGIHNPLVQLPKTASDSGHVWHIFAIRCKEREKLQSWLLEHDIKTAIHYPIPPHLQECYKHLGYQTGDFPIAEKYAMEELSLPIYNGMPDEDVACVINAINEFKG